MDMNTMLEGVSTYGVLPLLFLIIWVLHKKILELDERLKKKEDELLGSAKENVALLHKVIAVLNKITKRDVDEL